MRIRLLCLSLLPCLAGCHSDRFPPSHEAGEAGAGPSLVCQERSHDFGKVEQGDRLAHAFRLHNDGGRPLRIRDITASYSCRSVDSPSTIEPGASATVQIQCDSEGRSGLLRDQVLVHTNDRKQAKLSLLLKAEIVPMLAFDPALVEISPEIGSRASKEVRLVGARASEARLRVESVDPPQLDVVVLAPADSKPAGLQLTVDARSVRTLVGKVVVATGLDAPARLTLNYSSRVSGNLRLAPSNPHFNLRDPRGKEQLIRVTSRRADLLVTGTEVSEGPFEARLERDSRGDQAVRVRVVDEALDAGQRAVLGELTIFTNDPFEPDKKVPLFALGPTSELVRHASKRE